MSEHSDPCEPARDPDGRTGIAFQEQAKKRQRGKRNQPANQAHPGRSDVLPFFILAEFQDPPGHCIQLDWGIAHPVSVALSDQVIARVTPPSDMYNAMDHDAFPGHESDYVAAAPCVFFRVLDTDSRTAGDR